MHQRNPGPYPTSAVVVMRSWLAHLLFIVGALLVAGTAWSAQCLEYAYSSDGPWFKSQAAACSAYLAFMKKESANPEQFVSAAASGNVCTVQRQYNGKAMDPLTAQLQQRTSSVCEDNACKAGPGKTLSFTVGYFATPEPQFSRNTLVKKDPFYAQAQQSGGAASMCYNGCRTGVDFAQDNGETWISQIAGANGLYRASANVTIQGTSQTCTEAPPEAVNPATPPPPCPGSLGQVNGATVCLPTASNDTGVDLGGKAEYRGNPTAGSETTGKTPAEIAGGSGPAETASGGGASGGPAGTGANNSPGGKGCNDGSKTSTPACSGKGTLDADGNTTKPGDGKEQANCGAPGQPKCSIDETGTPDGKTAYDGANKKLEDADTKRLDGLEKIKSTADKDTSWGVMPSWITPGGCEKWNLGSLPLPGDSISLDIDVCAIKPYVDAVMNFLWAVGTFFAVIAMVFRVTTGTAS